VRVTTWEKERFLKKMLNFNIKNFSYLLFFFLLFCNTSFSETKVTTDISEYLKSLKHFKCSFIQANPDGSVSEGSMIYSDKRFRINYESPTKILFIAKEKKAMYYNKDLEEVHYFNPNKTAFNIFKSIFDINNLSEDYYTINIKQSIIEISIKNIQVDDIQNFKIIFQNKPLLLKKITWGGVGEKSVFSIYNIEKEPIISKKTFNMAHPLINN